MSAPRLSLAILACAAGLSTGQAPQPGPMPRELKPQWQRALAGDDAKKADDLEKRIHESRTPAKFREVVPLAEELVALRTRVQGADHWETTDARLLLWRVEFNARLTAEQRDRVVDAQAATREVAALYQEGKFRQAIQAAEKAARVGKEALGETHRDYVATLNNLAVIYHQQHLHAKAEPAYREAVRASKEVLGDRHPQYASTLGNLAKLLQAMEMSEKAEAMYQDALRILADAVGPKHPDYAICLANLAEVYLGRGTFVRAEPLYREAVRIYRDALGADSEEYAQSLSDLAHLYRTQGAHAKAEPLLKDSVRVLAATVGEKHPKYASSVNGLANVYSTLGAYARAEPLYREAVRIRRDVLGEDHPDYAQALGDLAHLYLLREEYAKAEPLLKDVARIIKASVGPDHQHYAISLCNLAKLYTARGDYAKAEPLLQDAVRVFKATVGGKHPDYAKCLTLQARLYAAQILYARAEPLLREAVEILREVLGPDHPDYGECLGNLANLNYLQGSYADAEVLFRDAVRTRRDALGEDHPDYAQALGNLAGMYQSLGAYTQAEPLFLAALRIRATAQGKDHPDYARVLNNLGAMYCAQGNYAKAEPIYLDAVRILRETAGEKDRFYSAGQNNLGKLYVAQGRYAEAVSRFQEALRTRKETVGANDPDYAAVLGNLAEAYSDQGDYVRAEPLYREAVRIRRDVLAADHPDVAQGLSDLADVYTRQAEYAKAEPLYRDALRIFAATVGETHPKYTNSSVALAVLTVLRGGTADALATLRQASAGYEACRLSAAHGLDRAEAMGARTPYPLRAAVEARLGKARDAARSVEFDLARGLLDQEAGRRRVSLTAAEQRTQAVLAGRLAVVQSRILRLATQAKRADGEQRELNSLLAEQRKLNADLAGLAVALSQREVADLAAIQKALAPDAAIVTWIDVTGKGGRLQEHWACVVRSSGEPAWERLPGRGPKQQWTDDDDEVVGQFRTALRAGTETAATIDRLVEAVRRQRLDPVAKHLAGVNRLLVVGVNRMAGVPVELLAPEYRVEYVLSGTAVARAAGRPAAAGGVSLLGVGDPLFAPARAAAAQGPPLPVGGLLIQTVVPGGAAHGVLKPGDVLLAYAGTAVTDADGLGQAIAANARAKSVPAQIWRVTGQGEAVTKTVDLPPGRLGVTLAGEPARDVLVKRGAEARRLTALSGSGRIDPATGTKEPWKELAGTSVELDRLRKLFGDRARVLARSEASEQRLVELRAAGDLKGFRYVHFATHGLANHDRAFESFLVLAQDRLPGSAGAEGQPPVNGELSAREVLDDWKLDNCDLVTLSACESGLGRSGGGDGLLGFAQAFLVAGARSVCLSLWAVDDTATALLMDRFYQNLLGKREGLTGPMKKAAALREAKEWLRNLTAEEILKVSADMRKGVVRGKDEPLPPVVEPKAVAPKGDLKVKPFAHPRYWAAFILVGDPD